MERVRENRGIRRILTQARGATLVEMIVCFALLSIFLTSAAMVMSTYMKIFTHAREYGSQQTVASILLDTIEVELGAAEPGNYTVSSGTSEGEPSIEYSGVTIVNDSKGVYYSNRNGVTVNLYVDSEDQYLHLDYFTTNESNIPWKYGKGVYNNNKIKNIDFKPFSSNGSTNNCIKVTMELENSLDKSVTYKCSRVIRCYKLSGDADPKNKVHYYTSASGGT